MNSGKTVDVVVVIVVVIVVAVAVVVIVVVACQILDVGAANTRTKETFCYFER